MDGRGEDEARESVDFEQIYASLDALDAFVDDEERKTLWGRPVLLIAVAVVGACLVRGNGFAVSVGWGLVAWVVGTVVASVVHAELKAKS